MNESRPLSIIMPVYNEASIIEQALRSLGGFRRRGAEIIVVDGGSDDDTVARAMRHADQTLTATRGRAAQMNAGARVARGRALLFLHADTRLPPEADVRIHRALTDSTHCWGRFDVRIDGTHPLLRVIAWLMNGRSRLTGMATGDQGIFVTRRAFDHVGGFPQQVLMEDIALCRRLNKRLSRPACVRERVTTSGRRWEKTGVLRTIILMWWLRLAYFCGVPPARLARWYRHAR